MECTQVQEVVSASLDGEAEPEELARALAHVQSCMDCRRAREAMSATQGLVRHFNPESVPDLSSSVRDESRRVRRLRRSVVRGLLAVDSLLLFLYVIPEILATSGDAHLEHHLAVWGATFATTLALIAIKPSFARVVRPIATLFVVAMAIIALIDIMRGETPMLAETHHLLEVAGAILIWLLGLPQRRRSPATLLDSPVDLARWRNSRSEAG